MDSTKTILQVPLDTDLKIASLKAAKDLGFSSLQEAIRVYLQKLATGKLNVSFTELEPIQLSPRAIKRLNKIDQEIDEGKADLFTAETTKELMAYLEGKKSK